MRNKENPENIFPSVEMLMLVMGYIYRQLDGTGTTGETKEGWSAALSAVLRHGKEQITPELVNFVQTMVGIAFKRIKNCSHSVQNRLNTA